MPARTPGSRAVISALPDRSAPTRISVVGSPMPTSSARAESMVFRMSGVISNVLLVRTRRPIWRERILDSSLRFATFGMTCREEDWIDQGDSCVYTTASIRSRATLASRAVSCSTSMRFTTTPSFRPSMTHERYAGWILYIVEQGQITESRQNTSLSGFSAASLLTRLISVPIAHFDPAGSVRDHLPDVLC